MKALLAVALAFTFITTGAFAGTKQELDKIGEAAQTGNGGYGIQKYDVEKFDKKAAVEKLKEQCFEGCTWKTLTSRRQIIKELASGGTVTDEDTAAALEKLYKAGRIKAMIGVLSDNDISCTRFYIELYTTDGYLLGLNFDGSD